MTIRPASLSDCEIIADFNARMAWETEHKKLDLAILTPGVRAVLTSNDKGFYTAG
jgi:hypothetical protein